jgi:DNA mismatch repair protein MutS
MRVKEWQGDIVFLHEVMKGAADRSYGIHVAKLAGLPPAVIARAGAVLAALEDSREARKPSSLIDDLPLFGAAARAVPPSALQLLVTRLADINPDALSPREALEILYSLVSDARAI